MSSMRSIFGAKPQPSPQDPKQPTMPDGSPLPLPPGHPDRTVINPRRIMPKEK